MEARSKESKHLPFYRFEAGSIQGDVSFILLEIDVVLNLSFSTDPFTIGAYVDVFPCMC